MIILSIGIIGIVAAAAVLTVTALKQRRIRKEAHTKKLQQQFEHTVSLYVQVLHEKVVLLDQYVSDYFNSMNESDFPKLKQLDEALQQLVVECHEHILNDNVDALNELIGFVEGRFLPVTRSVQELTTVNLHLINDWRKRAHEYLVSTVLVLKRTNTHNQVAEIQRQRNRMETEDMLNEIIRWTFPNQER